MAASPSLERTHRAAPWPAAGRLADPADVVIRAVGAAAAAAAMVSGSVITARRLAGAVEPAGPALLLGTVAAGVPLVIAADAARRAGASAVAPLLARVGVLVAVAGLGLPPRSPTLGGWLAVATAFALTALVSARMPRPGATPAACRAPRSRRGVAVRPGRVPRRGPRPGLLRQRFERRELAAGSEVVRGRIVVAVPAGARTAYGHLGFCPAFAATPTVELTTAYDGVEVVVSAAEVLPWGVRVECRLAEPAEESLEIPVDLVASAPAS